MHGPGTSYLGGKLASKTEKLAVIFQVGKYASGFLWEVCWLMFAQWDENVRRM